MRFLWVGAVISHSWGLSTLWRVEALFASAVGVFDF